MHGRHAKHHECLQQQIVELGGLGALWPHNKTITTDTDDKKVSEFRDFELYKTHLGKKTIKMACDNVMLS